jgi:hypothetical protein
MTIPKSWNVRYRWPCGSFLPL